MKKALLVFLLYLPFGSPALAQIGGQRAFRFLELPASAKLAGLGGVNVTGQDHDVNMGQANPALLNPLMDKQLSFSHVDYLSDIRQSTLTYVHHHDRFGRWGVGLSYLNYGEFVQRDETGLEEGQFSVHDYVFSVTHSSTIDHFTLGGTAKLAVSSMADYKSVATLLDLGGVFKHPEQELYVGLALKNIGYNLKPFEGGEREPLPFDAQVGVTFKPEHMPFRFSVTAHHLYQFDIVYLDPNKKGTLDENGEEIKEKKTFGDKLARHFVVGTELLLSKNFHIRAGYNHLRRRELRLDNRSGGAGLSLGAMIRIRSFAFDYSRAFYHVAGASNYFTITTDMGSLFRRENKSGE
jgi:hypothetical protein